MARVAPRRGRYEQALLISVFQLFFPCLPPHSSKPLCTHKNDVLIKMTLVTYSENYLTNKPLITGKYFIDNIFN